MKATITRDGRVIGSVDVHLHHNNDAFSVGVTVHHYHSDQAPDAPAGILDEQETP